MITGAVMEGNYRYLLWRSWDESLPAVNWIMLNPSTADVTTDDATIRKCMKFARTWGYGGIKVMNLFAYRATDPKELKKLDMPTAVGPMNYKQLLGVLRPSQETLTVAAWGQGGKLFNQAKIVEIALRESHINLHALKLAKNGMPYHPLYLKDDLLPFRY